MRNLSYCYFFFNLFPLLGNQFESFFFYSTEVPGVLKLKVTRYTLDVM